MINCEHLTISHGRQTLLDDVTFRLARGQKVAICGPSGCGKSSLLLAMMGCFAPASGTITIDDTIVCLETVGCVRRSVAFVGQEPILGAETVRDALLLPFTFHANRHIQIDQAKIDATLDRLHLNAKLLDKPCTTISGGEKQRIAIARAVLMDKKIFLADEITSTLDPISRDAVINILASDKLTVLSVSHDAAWLDRQDAVYEINDHRLLPVSRDGEG